MHFSIKLFISAIVVFLLIASGISIYFAVSDYLTLPLLLVAAVNIAVVLILVVLVTRGVLLPLDRLRQTIGRVSEGELDIEIKTSSVAEIQTLTEDFNMMLDKIEYAEHLKTEFVVLAAHQMRTPLATTKWTLGSLMEESIGPINKEQKDRIQNAYQTNEHMISLINDLLDITAIQEGRYLSELTPFEIEPMVRSMVQSYKEDAERREVSLELEFGKEKLPSVQVDGGKIELALQNFIDNALQYTKKGGKVTVSVKKNPKKKEIEVVVKDTGIGIPDTQQQRVFDRFFRATNAKEKKDRGTGLGVYLAKNIIEAHKGRVWFESKEGKGSTFGFSLPIKKNG